ncbi:MAG: tRNA uridine-5-carboxymethylaminomethyl(34) synthesis enzyme MnmG [Bacilli bacterium]|nr:tRNA uridine-5-carboxymethylaminomethyl(34) synthesis enzyme MnmG [Bacilli bacterium]MBQ4255715.1 tRNA uridine-5-carboxymethylaminomethyl(34) synthesis enzyme MnmG [Bacilli bacterium]
MENSYDIIVIGGGHAGIEASYASAKLGKKVLLVTLNFKMVGNMPCNPHIGGSAKGVVVREIDALGGLMGIAADYRPLQIKMLNTGKGPAVQCLRSQQDKNLYPGFIQKTLQNLPNLTVLEDEVDSFLNDENSVFGVKTKSGKEIRSKAVILTGGTYLNSKIFRGREHFQGGPDGEKASIGLSDYLRKMGLSLIRLKTGTPPRLKKSTIDFSKAEIQLGSDDPLAFSYQTKSFTPLSEQLPCYLIYTTPITHQIILDHLNESSVFDGSITGIGPRYCPSIESKIVRFKDKERHQLFLEPEYLESESIYLQGFSTGLPIEVQEEMVHSLPGLEHAEILKYAYQIEYDAIYPTEFLASLECKHYSGLYAAGQVIGTSGYEEAGGLGLMAAINACLKIDGKPPFVLKRNEAYIGVMIDDLVTKGIDEPYRLLSSRAEYRLLLRHDNADARLSEYGHSVGLLSNERYEAYLAKKQRIEKAIEIMSVNIPSDREGLKELFISKGFEAPKVGYHEIELLRRPEFSYREIEPLDESLSSLSLDYDEVLSLETIVKFEGYLNKQKKEAERLMKAEEQTLPIDLDYLHMDGLRLEARQKLDAVRPLTLAQASRIPGVNPADLSILLLALRKKAIGGQE